MASPDGLRLYLGRRLPQEVLEHIFCYGFHLWMKEPVEVTEVLERGRGWARAETMVWWLVLMDRLSDSARRLVDFDRYIAEELPYDLSVVPSLSFEPYDYRRWMDAWHY